MITMHVNNKKHQVSVTPDTPLLWVLREDLKLTGTKFGCGEGLCGACTVHIGGEPTRSCINSVKEAEGKKITTIEGLPENHPVKRAWLEEEVSQCGYCQPGQIMTAAAISQILQAAAASPLIRRDPVLKPRDFYGQFCRPGNSAWRTHAGSQRADSLSAANPLPAHKPGYSLTIIYFGAVVFLVDSHHPDRISYAVPNSTYELILIGIFYG